MRRYSFRAFLRSFLRGTLLKAVAANGVVWEFQPEANHPPLLIGEFALYANFHVVIAWSARAPLAVLETGKESPFPEIRARPREGCVGDSEIPVREINHLVSELVPKNEAQEFHQLGIRRVDTESTHLDLLLESCVLFY